MSEQLSFDLTARPALGREDFFVSQANELAVRMLDDWPGWPGGKLLLTGPRGAGKSHLAHVWAADTCARIIRSRDLGDADIELHAAGPVCLEDIDTIAGDIASETAAFHLHNLALAQGQPLLLTAQGAPGQWGLGLADLASRLQGTTLVRIDPPDEALLGAVIGKLFADRQLSPQPNVIPYLSRHAPRSFDAARRIVEDMDRAALASGKRLTRALASETLARLDET